MRWLRPNSGSATFTVPIQRAVIMLCEGLSRLTRSERTLQKRTDLKCTAQVHFTHFIVPECYAFFLLFFRDNFIDRTLARTGNTTISCKCTHFRYYIFTGGLLLILSLQRHTCWHLLLPTSTEQRKLRLPARLSLRIHYVAVEWSDI